MAHLNNHSTVLTNDRSPYRINSVGAAPKEKGPSQGLLLLACAQDVPWLMSDPTFQHGTSLQISVDSRQPKALLAGEPSDKVGRK